MGIELMRGNHCLPLTASLCGEKSSKDQGYERSMIEIHGHWFKTGSYTQHNKLVKVGRDYA